MGNGYKNVSTAKAASFKPQGGAGGLAVYTEMGCHEKRDKGDREKLLEGREHTCSHPHMHTVADYFQVKLTTRSKTGNHTIA